MRRLLPMCLLLVLLLTGCSSSVDRTGSVTVKWENGVVSYGGKTLTLDEFEGYTATVTGPDGCRYNMAIENTPDITNLSINYQQVLEENMTSLKGGLWWTEYLGSYMCYAKMVEKDTCVYCTSYPTDSNMAANYAAQFVEDIPMTMGQVYVDFGDFVFGNDYDIVTVRNDACLIRGIAKVSIGTYNCNTPVTVTQGKKEYQLMKGSSSKYDYYQYGDYLIQVGMGLDISNYIQFK